jgi:chemotaxis protein MotB
LEYAPFFRKEVKMQKNAFFVAILALSFGCGISKEIYERDTKALMDQLNQSDQEKKALLAEKERLMNEVSALAKEKGSLSQDLKLALEKMEELKQQALKRKQALQSLKAKLQEMVAAGKLKVRTDRGRIIVEMSEQVLFDVGQSKLKPEGMAALDELTPILISLQGRQFQVAGHTDNTGSEATNWKLSMNRALEVTMYMIERGMPPDRISAAGYAFYAPVAPNDTPEGRARNRRIEIVLVPNIEELMGFEEE